MNFDPQLKKYLQDYTFSLPGDRIADRPAKKRDDSLLLYVEKHGQNVEDRSFRDLPDLLEPGDVLVRNVTRVSRRRVFLFRSTGGRHEVLFLEPGETDNRWHCLVRGRSRLKPGETLHVQPPNGPGRATRGEWPELLYAGPDEGAGAILETQDGSVLTESFFDAFGKLPIPPYLNRDSDELDDVRYQTVYAGPAGSVAAPTAGLHFTPEIMDELSRRGVKTLDLELRVGYGTFAPLEEKNFQQKLLHRESYYIPEETARGLQEVRRTGRGRIISVGTTTLRALEDCSRKNSGSIEPGHYSTNLFLFPPDRVLFSDGLITNFHLPGSSLLLLVASFLGKDKTLEAYKHAIAGPYRFYSYGDAMLIL